MANLEVNGSNTGNSPTLKLYEVKFAGPKLHDVYEDDAPRVPTAGNEVIFLPRKYGAKYDAPPTPQWKDNTADHNGDALDSVAHQPLPDFNFPICITSGSTLTIPAKGLRLYVKNDN